MRLKITRRMLQWWREHRLIQASSLTPSGWCEFDAEQALMVAIVAELRRKGMSLIQIRRLRLKPAKIAGGDFLVTDTRRVAFCAAAEILPLVCKASRGCFVVSLKDLRERLTAPAKTRKASA